MVTPMNRRSFLAMTGLAGAGLLGAGSLAGCGSGSGSGSTYTIQFWEAFQFSNESQFFTDYFVTPFNNSHKDIQVELTLKQIQTLFPAESTALAAGSGPDIIVAPGSPGVTVHQGGAAGPPRSLRRRVRLELILRRGRSTRRRRRQAMVATQRVRDDGLLQQPRDVNRLGTKVPTSLSRPRALLRGCPGQGHAADRGRQCGLEGRERVVHDHGVESLRGAGRALPGPVRRGQVVRPSLRRRGHPLQTSSSGAGSEAASTTTSPTSSPRATSHLAKGRPAR